MIKLAGKLFLVGTPIGNLGDMSKRAIETIENCDFIAAEDTRVTMKLLNYFNIKKPMISYFEHNKAKRTEEICKRIEDGEICVLVSDAGMPAISDPGEDLVKRCVELGIDVNVVPGPSAVISAIVLSCLPTGRFTFEGFLSMNKKRRLEHLESIKCEKRTMVFYEAPHKLSQTLIDLYNTLGNRDISIVREITKVHEEVIRTNLLSASEKYKEEKLKGEIVLVISGADDEDENEYTLEDAEKIALSYIEEGLSISEASKKASKITGIKKGEIYKNLM